MTSGIAFEPLVPIGVIAGIGLALLLVLLLVAVRWRRARAHTWVRRATVIALLALACAGPQLGTEATTRRERPDVQLVVALDRTASMAVRDQDTGSRLDAAVGDLERVLVALPSPVALVTWGAAARAASPFSTDTVHLTDVLRHLESEPPAAGVGSRIERPLSTLRRLASRVNSGSALLFVVLLSDGEDTKGGGGRSFASLGRQVAGGAVIGYGSVDGGPVPLGDRPGYVPAPEGPGDAVSRRDDDNLGRVATELGVPYLARDQLASVNDIAELLEAEPRTVAGPAVPVDATWLAGLLLLVLLTPELRTAVRSAREVAAVGGRS